ncbi:MAG: GTPase [Clostridia bacterium]|nr:GTPase [Clostridia bacterium]
MNGGIREIPVYLFTGFLEAGKTKFIQETFEDERFSNGENTLLLVCEEGEEEYDRARFKGRMGTFHTEIIEKEEDLTEERLFSLQKKYDIDRVVVEYNGMWMIDTLYSAMPEGWMIYQEIMFAESSTFFNYNANMRSLVVDKLKSCELVVFNRADRDFDKMAAHKIVRAISRRTNIAYEYKDGSVEYDEIEDPPPYDMNAPIIEIKDEDYAFWYADFADKPENYRDKTVRIKVMVAKNKALRDNEIVVGRRIMTCCIEDVQYKGIICICDNAAKYKTQDWIILTAKISFEPHRLYHGQTGPVLYANTIRKTEPLVNDVATY